MDQTRPTGFRRVVMTSVPSSQPKRSIWNRGEQYCMTADELICSRHLLARSSVPSVHCMYRFHPHSEREEKGRASRSPFLARLTAQLTTRLMDVPPVFMWCRWANCLVALLFGPLMWVRSNGGRGRRRIFISCRAKRLSSSALLFTRSNSFSTSTGSAERCISSISPSTPASSSGSKLSDASSPSSMGSSSPSRSTSSWRRRRWDAGPITDPVETMPEKRRAENCISEKHRTTINPRANIRAGTTAPRGAARSFLSTI
mmetsp:Transcript_43765/g.133188  ORF Transcript_43765/g.133188 Transcript_43765/m.133188 type:complete len:258 (+) Transcript_43765:822-1595(+)